MEARGSGVLGSGGTYRMAPAKQTITMRPGQRGVGVKAWRGLEDRPSQGDY
jgi:hypothetical protein